MTETTSSDRVECYTVTCQLRLLVATRIIRFGVWLSPGHRFERPEGEER